MGKRSEYTPQQVEANEGLSRPIIVNGANRQAVRKWLVAHGMASAFVYGLSMTELALAFNQPDGAGMAGVQRKYDAWQSDCPDDAARAAADDDMQAPPVVPQGNSADIVSAIAAIAAGVMPRNPGVDAEAVRAIVREEMANLPKSPLVQIEITSGGDTTPLGEMAMHAKFPVLVKALAAGCHVMLVGPAGSGKTTGAEMAAKALGREFRIEGAVSGEHKLTGYCDAHGNYKTTPYRDAFENGHIFVKDEIDGDDPAGLLALNAGMANGFAAFPDSPVPVTRGDGFQVVACANTWGLGADRQYVGRNQLDAATLDRFVMIDWGYDETLEAALCQHAGWLQRVQNLRRAAASEKARLVISPRASIHGAKLLAAGLDWPDVEAMTIWKGCDSELRRRIEARA